MKAIEVEELTKNFGSFCSVDHINFSVERGSVFGFLGANGAGKSTTIRMLCGILQPSSGDALVNGYSISKEPDKVKLNIGYMSQKFSLYNDLSVSENIAFFGGVYGLSGNKLKERREWVLEVSNLKGRERTLTGILPGGIKQRLALGVAVIHQPGIVFLDEPTSGVDPVSRRSFWELINQLSSNGTTVMVTTHYLEEAEYCDKITFIDAGKIIAEGTAGKLKTEHIKTPMFEIECENPLHLLPALESSPFAEEISLFGTNIHLLARDTGTTAEDILAFVRNSAAPSITNINTIVPTLEDVFITLLERRKGR